MNNFYLVRHGDKPNIAGDPSISELGILQSQLTGKYLKDKSITKVFCSPFKRTLETAEEIGKILGLEFAIDERLKERLNFGDDPNLTFEQFIEVWDKTTRDRNYQPKVGYSSKRAGDRVLESIKDIADKYPDQNIVLVTHGGVIYDVLRNLFSDNYLKSIKSDFLQTGIMNCSITHIVKDGDKYGLKEFDFVGHLPQPIK